MGKKDLPTTENRVKYPLIFLFFAVPSIPPSIHPSPCLTSPAGLDSVPGRGYVDPAVPRRCNPHSRRRRPGCSGVPPSGAPAPCSTGSPPPGSCGGSHQALPHAQGQSHRSAGGNMNYGINSPDTKGQRKGEIVSWQWVAVPQNNLKI